MSDILCLYYSRTGKTKRAMEEIAGALDAELVEFTNGEDYSGAGGFLRAGKSAMQRKTLPIEPFDSEKPLSEYRLVILGTPVWAGRCSSPARGLLKRRGLELERVAYVLTRAGKSRYEDVFDQMDQYTAAKHVLGVSLRVDDVGYAYWRDDFIQNVKRYMEQTYGG
jgi:hypothetical protein